MDKTKYSEEIQGWMSIVEANCDKNSELALEYCNKIIAYGHEHEDDGLLAYGHYYSGAVHYISFDGTRFYMSVTNALSYLSKVEEWALMARCYNFLGIFSISRGNSAIAFDYYLSAIECCQKAKADRFAAMVRVNIGALYITCGRYQDAVDALKISLEYFQNNDKDGNTDEYMVCIYENMAKAYLSQGKLEEAKKCFDNIYSTQEEIAKHIMITVWCTEAMYYHVSGQEEKCEECIAKVQSETTEKILILDMFDDYYDYCRILLDRGRKEELWHLLNITEPMIRSLDMTNLMLKILSLKLKYYRREGDTEAYQKTATQFFELTERAEIEAKVMMSNVLNLRKKLEKANREKKEIEEKNTLLKRKSETDALTGLNNRFRLNDYSKKVFQNAYANQHTLAVEILDMDSFKEYNDTYGHQKGDECIKEVALTIKSMEEFGAFTARYGGDEFVLIYENITKAQAEEYAAELRKRIIALNIEHKNSKVDKVMTISQGLCVDIPAEENSVNDYIHAADNMLYRVKQNKRNNYCIGDLTESEDQIVMSQF